MLRHADALLRADTDQRLWERLARELLYDVSDRLEQIGLLDLVRRSLDAVANRFVRFPQSKAEEPYWRSGVRRRLAEAAPSNAGWQQRDLSFSLTRIAEFYKRQGDRTEALRFAKESLEIDERLAALDPTNATWQKDVEVSRALVARLRGDAD